jgi:hypothetical protein
MKFDKLFTRLMETPDNTVLADIKSHSYMKKLVNTALDACGIGPHSLDVEEGGDSTKGPTAEDEKTGKERLNSEDVINALSDEKKAGVFKKTIEDSLRLGHGSGADVAPVDARTKEFLVKKPPMGFGPDLGGIIVKLLDEVDKDLGFWTEVK